MKPPVGLIGLGLMGKPMGANLLKAGHVLTVWNRTASRGDDLVAQGAKRAASPREVAAASEVILTIVSDPPALESVLWGESGVFSGLRRGSVMIESSTVSPGLEKRAAAAAAALGADFLEAPVTGGTWGADMQNRGAGRHRDFLELNWDQIRVDYEMAPFARIAENVPNNQRKTYATGGRKRIRGSESAFVDSYSAIKVPETNAVFDCIIRRPGDEPQFTLSVANDWRRKATPIRTYNADQLPLALSEWETIASTARSRGGR
jgi:hypothetical protein